MIPDPYLLRVVVVLFPHPVLCTTIHACAIVSYILRARDVLAHALGCVLPTVVSTRAVGRVLAWTGPW